MIMILDYMVYWVWSIFLYSLISLVGRDIPIKDTFLSKDSLGMGVISLIAYMLIYRYGETGFVFL